MNCEASGDDLSSAFCEVREHPNQVSESRCLARVIVERHLIDERLKQRREKLEKFIKKKVAAREGSRES